MWCLGQGSRRGAHAEELDDPNVFFTLGQQLEMAAAEDIDLDEDDETGQEHPGMQRVSSVLLNSEEGTTAASRFVWCWQLIYCRRPTAFACSM